MDRLLKPFGPLARSGRLLARLFSSVQAQSGQAEGRPASPACQLVATKTIFLRYLNDALSGGGRR